MVKFLSVKLEDRDNISAFLNLEKVKYIMFDEQDNKAVFMFDGENSYRISAKKEQIEDIILGLEIPVRQV